MNVERAAEIIAAYGGDPARWPADERAAVLQLVDNDTALARARSSALVFDTELTSWARSEIDHADAGAAAARVLAAHQPVRQAARPVWRWTIGTGIAAALAVGITLTNPFAAPGHRPGAHSAASDAAAFAMVFTPTPDEEGAI